MQQKFNSRFVSEHHAFYAVTKSPSSSCSSLVHSGASSLCRMVFTPFSLQLRHAKKQGTSGQDLRIQAPEIHATLSSCEFQSFMDVVRFASSLRRPPS